MTRSTAWCRGGRSALTLLLVLVAGCFLATCGSGGSSGGLTVLGSSRSPGPVVSSPAASPAVTNSGSPSPSSSPVYLDPATEFETYLAAVKPIRMSFHRLALRLNRVIWKQAHKYADASWPPAGRKVNRLSKKMDGMRVDWDVVVPPADLLKAHAAYLRCMRANQLAYQKIAFYLINKSNWSADSRNGRRVRRLWNQASRNFDVFKHKIMVQSRQLDVKVPWKW